MDFKTDTQIIQNQKTAITPKMVEELKILQMSNTDLMQYIDVQLSENPLLEISNDGMDEFALPDTKADENETDENDYEEQRQINDFTSYTSRPVTLRQHLLLQVRELCINSEIKKVVFYLIETINDDGYLGASINDVSHILKIPVQKVKKALKVVQKLEPAGIGARNLKECILLQLNQRGNLNNTVTAVVKDHLELLAEKKYKTISEKLGLPLQEIADIHQKIKHTDPKPGLKFSEDAITEYIRPELVVKVFDDKFAVLFNDEGILSLKVSEYYRKLIKNEESTHETRKYIKLKVSKAKEIINAIEQRKRTIISVASCIIEYQEEFLRKGHMFLLPLTLKMVADKTGLHESTISRTVNDKYIETPRGVFELKFFLSSHIEAGNDTGIASSGVKKAIKVIVENENRKNPLSDEMIRRMLEKDGIQIARRTVAKYREELSILPAKIRKDEL